MVAKYSGDGRVGELVGVSKIKLRIYCITNEDTAYVLATCKAQCWSGDVIVNLDSDSTGNIHSIRNSYNYLVICRVFFLVGGYIQSTSFAGRSSLILKNGV